MASSTRSPTRAHTNGANKPAAAAAAATTTTPTPPAGRPYDTRHGSVDPPERHGALTTMQVRRVSVEAIVDPRSIYRYLHGMPQTSTMRERIERALAALGFTQVIGYATRATATAASNGRRELGASEPAAVPRKKP